MSNLPPGVKIDLKVDDTKVMIIRGPASLRDLAIGFVEEYERPDGPETQYDRDRAQVVAWLKALQI